ncbi:unnamed protein product [Fusarium graminearum]|nr:hypothetical protein FG05_11953 [Fusarium graminearum]CZS76830.1 unnamed protein product [Fusarium graminearum]
MRLNSKPPKIDFGPLREKFLGVVAKPWTLWRIEYEDQAKLSLSQVKHTMQLETQKQPIPRKVVILDCEYGFGLKLLEFSIVDRETNEVLINTLIRQTDVEADLRLKQFPPSVQNADKLREEKIFANANTLTLMDVNQVAKALRRHNMKEFGMERKLSNVFELLYPGHDLIGHNHRALPDCQQTMLVLDAFDEFCKPNEERKSEWKLETLVERFSAVAVQATSVSAKRRRASSTEREDAEGPSGPKRTRLSSKMR